MGISNWACHSVSTHRGVNHLIYKGISNKPSGMLVTLLGVNHLIYKIIANLYFNFMIQ